MDDLVRDHREAGGHEQHLLHGLVDPQRRTQHAGAHVRDPGQLEHALDRPVLAVGAVEDGEHHVDLRSLASVGDDGGLPRIAGDGYAGTLLAGHPGQFSRSGAALGELVHLVPAPSLVDPDQQHLIAIGVEGFHHRPGRGH